MLNIDAIGQKIKELRKEKGLTQTALAEALHVSFQAISNWERGIAPPDLENLICMASFFEVLVDDLLRPKNENLFLGIDGGGTKTEFALITSDGYVIKHFLKSGCNPNDIGYSEMATLLIDGIENILIEYQPIKAIFLGIAGISTGNYADRLYAELKKHFPQIKIQIKNDSANLFAFDQKADMAVISGTGSVVFFRNGDHYRRLGGWGHLFDGAGSAYDIGRDVIRESLREEDMQEAASLMSNLLREKLNTATVWEHINTIYSKGKPYIAKLASVVFDAYEKGDKKAIDIIDKNAKALADWLNAGVNLYGANPVAIASGGLFEHYTDIMTSHIEKYSDVKLIINRLPPVYGACRKACELVFCEIPDNFYENFKKTYGEIKK